LFCETLIIKKDLFGIMIAAKTLCASSMKSRLTMGLRLTKMVCLILPRFFLDNENLICSKYFFIIIFELNRRNEPEL